MAVCCQTLTLCALSSRSALSVLVGALFKKFGIFLNCYMFIPFRRYLHLVVVEGLVSSSNSNS